MKLISRAFRAVLAALILRTDTTEFQMIQGTFKRDDDARAIFVEAVLELVRDVRNIEFAAALYIAEESDIIDMRLYHKARMSSCDDYAASYRFVQRESNKLFIALNEQLGERTRGARK
jgi:hypothetical protein